MQPVSARFVSSPSRGGATVSGDKANEYFAKKYGAPASGASSDGIDGLDILKNLTAGSGKFDAEAAFQRIVDNAPAGKDKDVQVEYYLAELSKYDSLSADLVNKNDFQGFSQKNAYLKTNADALVDKLRARIENLDTTYYKYNAGLGNLNIPQAADNAKKLALFNHYREQFYPCTSGSAAHKTPAPAPAPALTTKAANAAPTPVFDCYGQKFVKVGDHIHDGDCGQNAVYQATKKAGTAAPSATLHGMRDEVVTMAETLKRINSEKEKFHDSESMESFLNVLNPVSELYGNDFAKFKAFVTHELGISIEASTSPDGKERLQAQLELMARSHSFNDLQSAAEFAEEAFYEEEPWEPLVGILNSAISSMGTLTDNMGPAGSKKHLTGDDLRALMFKRGYVQVDSGVPESGDGVSSACEHTVIKYQNLMASESGAIYIANNSKPSRSASEVPSGTHWVCVKLEEHAVGA